ncbi:MAG: cell division protein CrgA [Actinobacteria bacterium]|nr:cell division protein CrgA [Actinomycetota bacterium]
MTMAKRNPKAGKHPTGRVTPKGTRPGSPPPPSSRYTPPVPKATRTSSRLVPILMFGLFALGLVTIILNYVGVLPGDTSNGYLILGLAFITGGFVASTQFR